MNDELQALQEAIQVLHQLMTVLDDPNDTRVVAQCLSALTGIQKNMMQNQQAGGADQARAGLVQQLQQGGGAQPQAQPQGGGGGY